MVVLNRRAMGALLIACGLLGGCATVPVPDPIPAADQLSQPEIDALSVQAEQAAVRKEYAQAIALYERVVRASPHNAQARFRLGTLRLKANQYQLAQRDFEYALQSDPNMNKAYANLALTHLHQFRVAAAQAIASDQVSDANRATLRSLMRDVNEALFLPPTLSGTVPQ